MQVANTSKNAFASAWEADLGADPVLEFRSGAAPATCADADTGTLIGSAPLPTDPFTGPTNGVLTKSGTWEDPAANNAGTIGHYRFKTSGGVCKGQGPASDLNLVTNVISAAGQPITMNSFTFTFGGT